ncbi:hypothetical protein GHK48_02670 [Sinorhizobium fredii]|uniref:Uncharacterized protein n=1 Tax=Rhizobium fredii TaxID=380 RepID=A0A844A2F5_RHIFR|nr:hypothetical protein [Sinorhizobium fredii]MQX07259.1 hypothetical protein [Sinorhizobium fredii]UTY45592.1 hypothetical protein EPK84_01165 [Sinorhizobium fredii]
MRWISRTALQTAKSRWIRRIAADQRLHSSIAQKRFHTDQKAIKMPAVDAQAVFPPSSAATVPLWRFIPSNSSAAVFRRPFFFAARCSGSSYHYICAILKA